jgi:hypothetical protein
MLHASGVIRLSQRMRPEPSRHSGGAPHLADAGHSHLDAVLDGKTRFHFDTHDSREIAVAELTDCDFYFKRSYSATAVAELPAGQRDKVRPLGLNYQVLPDQRDFFAVRRSLRLDGFSRKSLVICKQALDIGNRLGFRPRLAQLHAPPDPRASPRAMFLAVAYNPHDDPGRSPDKVEERFVMNETRASCMRLLRRQLGERFLGGFASSPFALDHYPDLVVARDETTQRNYLRTLQSYPICIASSGLHGSTGWKLAEYVAFAKAIVTEKLNFQLPGSFVPGHNYLEFASPVQCVDQVVRLVEDTSLREDLMRNNAAYYEAYVRPDRLVAHALSAAQDLAGAQERATPAQESSSARSDALPAFE